LAYLAGLALLIAGIFIMLGKKTGPIALWLGGFFLFLFLAFHTPYLLFINPNSPRHLGIWTNPLKEVALAGGAWVIAGSGPLYQGSYWPRIGSIFFSIMLIAFGIDHFFYADFVATLVPTWIPGPFFWTYFAGIALIGSGAALILGVKTRQVALLLGIMLFLWVVMLHIPRALVAPATDQGNEITSVWEAMAFSGVAFVLYRLPKEIH
jgi:uncharacterized membrane protein YphA (DoxX/SURF4 family)